MTCASVPFIVYALLLQLSSSDYVAYFLRRKSSSAGSKRQLKQVQEYQESKVGCYVSYIHICMCNEAMLNVATEG